MTKPVLARSVPIRFPLGGSSARVAAMFRTIGVLAVIVVVVPAVFPKRRFHVFSSAPEDATLLQLHEYADSAFLAWMRVHPTRSCPDSLLELNVYTNHRSSETVDLWDTPIRMRCEPGRFRVESAGPDRRFDTEDDLDSSD